MKFYIVSTNCTDDNELTVSYVGTSEVAAKRAYQKELNAWAEEPFGDSTVFIMLSEVDESIGQILNGVYHGTKVLNTSLVSETFMDVIERTGLIECTTPEELEY